MSRAPLAERMRPRALDEVLGQPQLIGPGAPLSRLVEAGSLPSLVLWGPPGTGKTTIARLLAAAVGARFIQLSAVLSGVKDIRAAIAEAGHGRQRDEQSAHTVLFIDEIHRFNKAQQDALLPHVEDGTVTLIGATTENPAFELNNALLSRMRVFVLQPIDAEAMAALLDRAATDAQRGAGMDALPPAWRERIVALADGDARRALGMLESLAELQRAGDVAADAPLEVVFGQLTRRFDKGGDAFYDQISALHKSVRGSDPDGAVYWLCRMLDGGADPAYVARRLVRMASEDVGLADPRALQLALDGWAAYERLGSPEGDLALAEVAIYLASVPKSNAAYAAYQAARAAVAAGGSLPVPLHLRNAPTALARAQGHGAGYRYDPDQPDGHARGQRYLPDELGNPRFYRPRREGLEARIAERLQRLGKPG